MADQLYLENIDEFVTDQNKIVRSEDWGTRARAWGPGPSEGGGGPGPLCVRSRGGGSGEDRSPSQVPRGERELAGEVLWPARQSSPRGWSCWAPGAASGPRREGHWWLIVPRRLCTWLTRWRAFKAPHLQLRRL